MPNSEKELRNEINIVCEEYLYGEVDEFDEIVNFMSDYKDMGDLLAKLSKENLNIFIGRHMGDFFAVQITNHRCGSQIELINPEPVILINTIASTMPQAVAEAVFCWKKGVSRIEQYYKK